ncbi:unnamed protein product [Discula destructiva]
MHNHAPRLLDQSPDRFNQSQEQLFHDFMNKLAQICDIRFGGATVTAVAALKFPDRVQYRFASNQRSESDLMQMEYYVTDVLETLRDWTEETGQLVTARVLRKVIAFCRPRLEVYVKAVASNSKACLESKDLAPGVAQKLDVLQEISRGAHDQEQDEDTFFENCSRLMIAIRKTTNCKKTYKAVRNKAKSVQHGQINPWAEMRHAAGRLLSYFEGVQTLIEAREQPEWAQLFYEFEILCVPSSERHRNPIVNRRKNVSAADILHRMKGSDQEAYIAALNVCAEELQRFGLDENIRAQTNRNSFCPIVHAEILVHESLTALPDPRFFEGYRYIGTSKPTCRLCSYYFQAMSRTIGDRVQVRQSHGNLYPNWRAPDLYDNRPEAVKRQEKILDEMMKSIRQDTFNTIWDKVGSGKSHDSNTSRTYDRMAFSVKPHSSSVVEDDLSDMASVMGGARLED